MGNSKRTQHFLLYEEPNACMIDRALDITEIKSKVTGKHCFYVFMGLSFCEKALRKLTQHKRVVGVHSDGQFEEYEFVKDIKGNNCK